MSSCSARVGARRRGADDRGRCACRAAPPGDGSLQGLLWSLADRECAAGLSLTTVPGLLFGTLSRARAAAAGRARRRRRRDRRAFLAAAALEAVGRADRRPVLRPPRPPRAGCSASPAAGCDARSCPGRARPGCWRSRSSSPARRSGSSGRPRWRRSPTAPRHFGLAQGFAFALINLAWGRARRSGTPAVRGSPRRRRPRSVPRPRGVCAVTFVLLVREMARRSPGRPLASRA